MTNTEKLESITNEELIERINTHSSLQDLIKSFGLPASHHNRTLFKVFLKRRQIDKTWNSSNYTLDELSQVVSKSVNWSDVCRKLNISICSANFDKLKSGCRQNNIDTTHFDKTLRSIGIHKRHTVHTVFVENSKLHRSSLRQFLIKSNLYTNKCSMCGIDDMWNNKPLKLEIDHINGIHNDNRIENLRWVCPNCHSQTSTYKKGKNYSDKDDSVQDLLLQQLYNKLTNSTPQVNAEFKVFKHLQTYTCKHCSIQFESKNIKLFCGKECQLAYNTKVNWDDVDVAALVAEHKNYEKVGRMLGVTGAAVKRQYLKTSKE